MEGELMTTATKTGLDLGTIAAKWKRALSDAASGPLIIAAEVLAVAERWDDYKAEAGGSTCPAFLRDRLGAGRDLAFFMRRADAVARLGEHTRRTWDHEAAVWASQVTKDDVTRARVVKAVDAYRVEKNNGNPLTLAQVRDVAKPILGRSTAKSARHCERCDRMAAALLAAGLPVPE